MDPSERTVKLFEMEFKNLLVDLGYNKLIRNWETKHREMTLKASLDVKRTGLGVQTRAKINVLQFIVFLKVFSIVNNTIVDNLSNQGYWRLSPILINVGHVDIINKEDQSSSRTKTPEDCSKFAES